MDTMVQTIRDDIAEIYKSFITKKHKLDILEKESARLIQIDEEATHELALLKKEMNALKCTSDRQKLMELLRKGSSYFTFFTVFAK